MQESSVHSSLNPNESWLDSRGIWISYVVLIFIGHLLILSVPFLDTPTAWTLTNTVHNVCMFLLLHHLKGAPFETTDQGEARRLTHWEQINHGIQYTGTRKFLTLVPVILFLVTSFYTNYEGTHFIINFLTLMFTMVPKLPHFHRVRLFGINRY